MRHTLYILYTVFAASLFSSAAMAQSEEVPIDTLIQNARMAQMRGDVEESFTYIDDALDRLSFTHPLPIDKWAEVVNLKAVSYSLNYDWEKAIKVGMDAQIATSLRPSQVAAEVAYNMASFHAGRGKSTDFIKAVEYANSARSQFSKRTQQYFSCVNDLAYYYILIGLNDDARRMASDAISSSDVIFAGNRDEQIRQLWSKATNIAEIEQYEIAVLYALATISTMEYAEKTNTLEYQRRLIRTAGFYFQQRDFLNEIAILEKTLPITLEVSGEKSIDYVDCLRKLALAYNHQAYKLRNQRRRKEEMQTFMNKYQEYEDMAREILIATDRLDDIRMEQLPLVSNQALKFFTQGNVDDAIRYESIAYDLSTKYKNNFLHAHSSANLAIYHHKLKDMENTLKFSREAAQYYDDLDTIHSTKEQAYNNISLYFHEAGLHTDALIYGLKAKTMLEQMGDTLSENYSKTLRNASVFYSAVGDSENANKYGTLSSNVMTNYVNANNEAFDAQNSKKKKKKNADAPTLQRIGVTNDMVITEWTRCANANNAGDVENVHDAYERTLSLFCQYMQSKFPDMSVEERKHYVELEHNILDFATTAAFSFAGNRKVVADAWNAILIQDGLQEYIQTADTVHISKRWEDIASSLRDDEAYVRFFITPTDDDVIPYSAFVVRKGWDQPKVAQQVFLEHEFAGLSYNDGSSYIDLMMSPEGRKRVLSDSRIGRMVWEPILDLLGNLDTVKAIHYMPLGILVTELDPGKLYLRLEEPIADKFTMIKE